MSLKMITKILTTIILATLLVSVALADTLTLKNGSVLKGTFVGFENGQFIFKITSGDNRNQGRTLRFPANEVAKLALDNDGLDPNDPRNDGYPRRDPGGSTGGGSTGGWVAYPQVAVRLEDQWIRSNINLLRGQRVRVEATGTIQLDGRTSTGPEGLRNRSDRDAPEPDEPDGILLAGVGQDANSPSIVIGRSREFTADRDGMLYFTVNHGDTRNARGAFQVKVQVEQSTTGGGGTGGGTPRGQERSFTVYANQPWLDTGIEVEPGMTFEITAEGTIEILNGRRTGPEGDRNAQASGSRYPVQDAGVGALLTRIRYRDGRESNILVVGRQGSATVEQGEYGRLLLGVNDDYFRDNSGSFTVRVRW
jgi:hypothetical protein